VVRKGVINVPKQSGQVVIYKRIIPKVTTTRHTDVVTNVFRSRDLRILRR